MIVSCKHVGAGDLSGLVAQIDTDDLADDMRSLIEPTVHSEGSMTAKLEFADREFGRQTMTISCLCGAFLEVEWSLWIEFEGRLRDAGVFEVELTAADGAYKASTTALWAGRLDRDQDPLIETDLASLARYRRPGRFAAMSEAQIDEVIHLNEAFVDIDPLVDATVALAVGAQGDASASVDSAARQRGVALKLAVSRVFDTREETQRAELNVHQAALRLAAAMETTDYMVRREAREALESADTRLLACKRDQTKAELALDALGRGD